MSNAHACDLVSTVPPEVRSVATAAPNFPNAKATTQPV